MRYAALDGKRVSPQPGRKGAVCELCGGPVVPKCGQLVTPYFSHLSGETCDGWAEPETEWHRNWKALFPDPWQEVVLGRHCLANGPLGLAVPAVTPGEVVKHRADIHTPAGLTLEFQHSSLATAKVEARNLFYRNYGAMQWVLDLTQTQWQVSPFQGVLNCCFTWRYPRRSFWRSTTPVWLDLPGAVLLRLDRILRDPGVQAWRGYGVALHKADWVGLVRAGEPFPAVWRPDWPEAIQSKTRRA